MKFTIHITHRHVEGAGLHNEYYEREVHRDIVEMIFRDYFHEAIAPLDSLEFYANVVERIKLMIKLMLDDLDIWGAVEKMFYDELREKYEEEYNK